MLCKYCGAQIPDDSVFCPICGEKNLDTEPKETKSKKGLPAWTIVVMIVLAISTIGFAAFGIYEFNLYNSSVPALTDSLNKANNQIENYKEEINELSPKADIYDNIKKAAGYSSQYGYGSKYFKVDQGIVVLRKSSGTKEITFTGNYNVHLTVTRQLSGNSASVEFSESSWTGTTTKLKITPKKAGVTVATFSNNVDSTTFKVLIIVTD